MPELPEVETIVRELREANIVGLTIKEIKVFWAKSIANQSPEEFIQTIKHQTLLDIQRRGKFLLFELSRDTFLVHLRMTGKFYIDSEDSEPHHHERVRVYLSDGRILRYEDQRKFGRWFLVNSADILNKIGIEPLSSEFTLDAFKELLKGQKRRIKPFLLDQAYIAGIGNIYGDEALWVAKVHPARTVDTLTAKEIKTLHQGIIDVLEAGVKNTGTSLGSARANYYSVSGRRGNNQNQLKVFRQNGRPCPRCGAIIQKIFLAQRGTHFCPNCQK